MTTDDRRNHGSCPWCAKGREHQRKRQEPVTEDSHES